VSGCIEPKKQVEFQPETLAGLKEYIPVCPYCKFPVAYKATTCVGCKKDFIWTTKKLP